MKDATESLDIIENIWSSDFLFSFSYRHNVSICQHQLLFLVSSNLVQYWCILKSLSGIKILRVYNFSDNLLSLHCF